MTQKDCRGTTCGVTKPKKTGVCLLLWMSLHLISGSYVPQEMRSAIENINQFYKVSDSDIYNNQPVISREVLKSSNAERKMVYMVGILETYEKLIGRMLKQLPTPSPPIAGSNQSLTSGSAGSTGSEDTSDIRQNLNDILEKVQSVKTTYYQEQEKLLRGLQELKNIQVNNVTVQNKALLELLVLYEEASSLPAKTRKRRTRQWQRQAKAKTNRRG